jgi:hypothetical protein
VDRNIIDPEQFDLVEKWRRRHALPDVVALWAKSQGPEARAMAFNAIAQDPRVLQRAARIQAVKMVAQAEDYVLSLENPAMDKSATWAAVAQFVQHAIASWRQSQKTYAQHHDMTGSFVRPIERQPAIVDPWDNALREFPHISEATGQLATSMIREFGPDVLKSARKPWDQVIALAVLRHAAQKLGHHSNEPDDQDALRDVLTIQSYATATGLSPMLVAYSGPGKPIAQALGLLQDARTLLHAVSSNAPGESEQSAIWQRAVDFHAYAIVALDHRILLDLPLECAYEIATAAMRHADALIQAPEFVEMPALPPVSTSDPRVVRLYARACLPPVDGTPPSD